MQENPKIGFIGFGEVGYYISKGLKSAGIRQILGYDNATNHPPYGNTIKQRAADANVELVPTMKDLISRSDFIILAVPGGVALGVSEEAVQYIAEGKMYIDLTSCAPSAKEKVAKVMKPEGAKFIDVGLMAAPKEQQQKALMYASGDGAEEFKATMGKYGMHIQIISQKAGDAMKIKELWNIYTKGLQALIWELLLASHKVGVDIGRYAPMIVKT